MNDKQLIERIEKTGIGYEEYFFALADQAHELEQMEQPLEADDHRRYLRLNFQRSSRVHKHYRLSEEMHKAIRSIDRPQLWMVLTESWCGDSAQILPQIARIAAASELITLKILPRDENKDLMQLYLTGGKESIPKLVAFDEHGRELFRWGPRPQAAAQLFKTLQAMGLPKEEIYQRLHLWYGRDRGQSVERELIKLITGVGEKLPGKQQVCRG